MFHWHWKLRMFMMSFFLFFFHHCWHCKLWWQPSVPSVTKKLASWRLSVYSEMVSKYITLYIIWFVIKCLWHFTFSGCLAEFKPIAHKTTGKWTGTTRLQKTYPSAASLFGTEAVFHQTPVWWRQQFKVLYLAKYMATTTWGTMSCKTYGANY